MNPVHAEIRPSTSHPGVIRFLLLGPRGVVRLYIAGRTLPSTPDGVTSFLRAMAKKWAPGGEWVDVWPLPLAPVRVREKPWEGEVKEWTLLGFDPESQFAEMEESVVLVSEEQARRRVYKKKAHFTRMTLC